ncbi:phosphate butyryltransferase [Staphylococcus cohnii]|uniref:phosphate acyltransferase n=1 Tax=Staphylococcus cohnii TaxID=29382 RepID=UPI001F57018A|nr:phosphate acyltransferase [Staphylococcus cohnii]MCI2941163.1 phosphate butyryltransferase [Staphylococcus cohnii]
MRFQQLVEPCETMAGNVAVLYANDEKMIAVLVKALELTNIDIFIYDTQDTTEIIRSFDLEPQILNRIHVLTFSSDYGLLKQCSEDLSQGKVTVLMKGKMKATSMISFLLSNKNFIDQYGFLNHVACFSIPNYHKTLMISDVAYNVAPTIEEKKQIIKNLTTFSKTLGYDEFNIGLLSSVEQASKKILSSIDGEKLKNIFNRTSDTDVKIDGPILFDHAISKKRAIEKNNTSSIAGNVDALLVSNIDVGSVLLKSLTYFGNASVSSLLLGAKFPIVFTSRTESKQNKLNSLLLALKSQNGFNF